MHHKNAACARRTGFVSSELYYWHDTLNWCGFFEPSMTLQPGVHFENPETKRRMHGLIQATGLDAHLVAIRPEPVEDEILRYVHPQSQIDHIRSVCSAGGGETGGLTPAGPASLEIARLAVGGVLAAFDAVIAGEVDNAYVLCRPPGHHALPEFAMGFCLFNNAGIGIRHAQKVHGIKRIAVIDWDVHHGNGTEAIFLDDPGVLTISLHQDNLFPPNSGMVEVRGAEGSNINIPLPAGSGTAAYQSAFERIVIPAVEAFKPEMIVIPSGFDASALDPLGIQMLGSEDYRWMTDRVLELADRHCGGRIVATHEGGYSATYVPFCGLAVIEQMCGAADPLPDPFWPHIKEYGGARLSGDQEKAIDRAHAAHFGPSA